MRPLFSYSIMILGIAFSTIPVFTQNDAPQILNLKAEHLASDKVIRITYDVMDNEGDELEIRLLASNNNGRTYLVNTDSTSGDIGYPIQASTGLKIHWKYDDTITNILDYQIKLLADDRYHIDIQELVDQVDSNRLKQNLQFIAQKRHRNNGLDHLNAVKDTLEHRFLNYGLQVKRQAFTFQNYNAHNVIGRLQGQSDERATFIIDAHFDAVSGVPGADDNGSGVAAVIEAARILSKYNFDNSIRFIGFDLEEAGLVGSFSYVNNGGIEAYDSIAGVFNFEMIGYYSDEPNSQEFPFGFDFLFPEAYAQAEADTFKGDFITNVANTMSNPLKMSFDSAAIKYVSKLEVISLTVSGTGNQVPDLRRSDHAVFWDNGYQALMLTDGANFRNPNYHQASDSIGTINFDFMSNVLKATIAAVAQEAGIQHSTSATSNIEKRTATDPQTTIKKRYILFPNPVDDILNIVFYDYDDLIYIKLRDANGKLIREGEIPLNRNNGFRHQMNLNSLSPGIYFLSIRDEKSTSVEKLVIE